MKFIPAIDLKDNRCVRLQKGMEEEITIFNDDPVEQAVFFEKKGCERIHIVDLDAAFGRKNINKKTIIEIRKKINCSIELGGGINSEEDFSFWINQGIDYLIVGSLAVKNKKLIKRIAQNYKNKIYIALDLLNQQIMIKGWVENSKEKPEDLINFYNLSFIKGFILTDISRDGMLEGLDMDLINAHINKTKKNIIVGGGLSSYEDLYSLNNIKQPNLEGVIAGKSFYSGKIMIERALQIVKLNA